MTLVEQMARFVTRASYDDLSEAARQQLKIRILDALGCAIGALNGPPIRIIREQIRREVDSGYRYGGDEFALILPHLGPDESRPVLERVAEAFRDEHLPLVSLSTGMAQAREGVSTAELVELADQAMYRAKQAGGDRVHAAEP